MIKILINEKHITAKDLALKFNVSTRTIYRDIDTLTISGIPIEVKKGQGGGIRIAEEFVLNKVYLSKNEQLESLNIINGMKKLDFLNHDNVLSKLDAMFYSSNNSNWFEIDFYHWGSKSKDRFNELREVILNKQVIKITYFNREGKSSEREVEPLKLQLKGYAWYLIAYCKSSEQIKVFKLNRISNLEKVEMFFTRNLPLDYIVDETYSNSEKIPITLQFMKKAFYKVYDEYNEVDIKELDNGDLVVKTEVIKGDWVINYIMGYGDAVKVIEPKWLREKVKVRLINTIKNYD